MNDKKIILIYDILLKLKEPEPDLVGIKEDVEKLLNILKREANEK